MKVLIVDDAAFTRLSLRQALEHMHFTVLEAGSAEAGFLLFKEHSPQLIISDLHLNGQSGIELFTQVARVRTVPFFLMTHRPDRETIAAAMAAGITNFLCKPIDPANLQKLIATHCPDAAAPALTQHQLVINLQEPMYTVAAEASKKMKLSIEAYITTLLSQMLQPPPPRSEKAEKAGRQR